MDRLQVQITGIRDIQTKTKLVAEDKDAEPELITTITMAAPVPPRVLSELHVLIQTGAPLWCNFSTDQGLFAFAGTVNFKTGEAETT